MKLEWAKPALKPLAWPYFLFFEKKDKLSEIQTVKDIPEPLKPLNKAFRYLNYMNKLKSVKDNETALAMMIKALKELEKTNIEEMNSFCFRLGDKIKNTMIPYLNHFISGFTKKSYYHMKLASEHFQLLIEYFYNNKCKFEKYCPNLYFYFHNIYKRLTESELKLLS